MIADIGQKEQEVKEIWLRTKDTIGPKEIFIAHLASYFDVNKLKANWNMKDPDWLFFFAWVKKWRAAEKRNQKRVQAKQTEEGTEQMRKEIEEMTDDDVFVIQETNRKWAVLMLKKILKGWNERGQADPSFFQNVEIREVRMLYRTIQAAEESAKRTAIAKGKLKLTAARTFLLPYQRMSVEDLIKLRNIFNASINRLLKLKSGRKQEDRPASTGTGGK